MDLFVDYELGWAPPERWITSPVLVDFTFIGCGTL
jgi:hypothetical protein